MSSKFSWISKIFKPRTHKSNEGKSSRFCNQARPRVEVLEDRVVPTTFTWLPTATGSYDWNNGANWSGGNGSNFPNAQDDVAIITSALTGDETINLNQAITLGTLDLGASSGTNAFTIAPNGGALTLSVSSGSATVAKTSGGADQIAAPLTFSSNVIFDNSLSAPNALSITSSTSGAKTVTVNSPTTNAGEVDFTAAGALNGAAGIAVAAGALGINSITLTSSNTIAISSGAVVNSSGEIQTTANGSSTYSAVTGAGTLQLTSTTDSSSSPDIYFNSNDNSNSNANYGTRIASNINLGSSQRYIWGVSNHNAIGHYGTNGDCVITGSISGSGGITFDPQVTYGGSGGAMEVPLYLTGANTFTGPLDITRGSVYLGNASALNGNDVAFNPAPGTNARLYLFGNSVTIGNLSSSGAGTSVIANSPGATATAATLTVTQSSAGIYAGTIVQTQPEFSSSGTVSPLSLADTGSATLTLSGTNTYTGTTTVSGGAVLSVGTDANLGNAGNIILDGGTLLANSSLTLSASRGIAVGPSSGSGSGEIDVAAGQTLTYGGTISDDGNSTLFVGSAANPGALNLNGNSTNSAITVAGGTLEANGTLVGTVTVNSGILGGSGAVGAVTDNATINPGLGATSILNTGNLSFGAGGVYSVDINGAGTAGANYDQLNVTGSITLTGATLQLNVGYAPTLGDSYTIIHNVNGTAITGTFSGVNEGNYFVAGGHLFRITYQGNVENDVVVTSVAPLVYYVEADGWVGEYNGGSWTGTVGQTVPDADPVTAGMQPAVFGGNSALAGSGFRAFTSVNAALAQIADDGAVDAALIDNGGAFNEDVVINLAIALKLQSNNSTFNSLADTVNNASIALNGVNLTTGGDNASTQFSSSIQGTGNLLKTGNGAWTLAGNNSLTGAIEISGGAIIVGSATALGVNPTVTVDANGTLSLNGNSYALNSLAGAGIVQDANAGPATLTVSSATNPTFTGILQDGTGAGSLSLVVTGTGALTLTGTSSISGSVTVDPSTLTNNGSLTAAGGFIVSAGSTLNGGGTDVGAVNVSGTIEAGAGSTTGILTTGDLSFGSGGIVAVQLNGTTAGSAYDQLSVTNVDLTGAVLVVTLGSGFDPAVGTTFEIISNTGGSITNTFTGLPEGSVTMIGGLPFTISYIGGDGNDVTLTRTSSTVTSDPVGPITVGTPVTFTATLANAASANTGTVSFYFDYGLPDQFQIGGAINLTGGSSTSASTIALPAGSDTITAVYTAGDGSVGILGTATIQVTSSTSPPTITGVVINQDISALYNAAGQPFAGAQRSMVNDIVYTFSEPVNILAPGTDPNVFTIAVATGWTGTVPTLSWAPVTGSGNTQWAVTFGGSSVSGGSIADGAYTVTVNDPASITAVSDSQSLSLASSGIGAASQSFYRLYGDINGDQFVNAADNVKFKNALTTYNAAFDFNGDSVVNAADNANFKNELTVNFSGFTATI